jgi:2-keto-3-deoxy-6-phosphogluconate aldolase
VAKSSEALFARELGFQELKFFPADLMGGVRAAAYAAALSRR